MYITLNLKFDFLQKLIKVVLVLQNIIKKETYLVLKMQRKYLH